MGRLLCDLLTTNISAKRHALRRPATKNKQNQRNKLTMVAFSNNVVYVPVDIHSKTFVATRLIPEQVAAALPRVRLTGESQILIFPPVHNERCLSDHQIVPDSNRFETSTVWYTPPKPFRINSRPTCSTLLLLRKTRDKIAKMVSID